MSVTRLLDPDDAPVLSRLLTRNRAHLAPWQPARPDAYATEQGQREAAERLLARHAAGTAVPLVITGADATVVGALNLHDITRRALQSCSVAYWLDEGAQGRGLATRALREAVELAFGPLRLHRVQAETAPANVRSRRVLERVGFTAYGLAPAYLHVGGAWTDHVLHQLLTPTPERVVTG